MSAFARFALVALLALSPGCASLVATGLSGKPYAGTRVDSHLAFSSWSGHADTTAHVAVRTAALLDLPGSLVLDTLFLPITLATSRGRW